MRTRTQPWLRVIVALFGVAQALSSVWPGGFTPPGLSTDAGAPLNAQYVYNSRNGSVGVAMLVAAALASPEGTAVALSARLVLEVTDRIAMAPMYPQPNLGNTLPPILASTFEAALIVVALRRRRYGRYVPSEKSLD